MKLKIDAVPRTSWGVSLKRKMPRSAWDKLRKEVHDRNGTRCETCGSTEKLHCHELWEFDDESSVQRLVGLGTICNMCHHTTHFGLATVLAAQGHLDINAVIAHFLKVNKCDSDTFQAHLAEARATWERRSKRKWRVDFGDYAGLVQSAK